MLETIFAKGAAPFEWLDLTAPSLADMEAMAVRFGLHPTSVKDCLTPRHPPKWEKIGGVTFIIVRVLDESHAVGVETIYDLTRKLAIFHGDGFLLTVHTVEQPYFTALKARWKANRNPAATATEALVDLLEAAISSFTPALNDAEEGMQAFEAKVFSDDLGEETLKNGYRLGREAGILKRVLRADAELFLKLQSGVPEAARPFFQSLREEAERAVQIADDVHESVHATLSLSVSLSSRKIDAASHRSNEVMRVLTIFSVFFLPLNFLAGLYGMNFEALPGIRSESGFTAMVVVMVVTSAAIFTLFRWKGWLRKISY